MPSPAPYAHSLPPSDRKHRQREREGLLHLGIDVPHEVIDRLIAENYLTEAEAADRHATGKALETFLVDQFG